MEILDDSTSALTVSYDGHNHASNQSAKALPHMATIKAAQLYKTNNNYQQSTMQDNMHKPFGTRRC
jgi:hypothetical protein